ncbi:magnesium/cobalt transporter CorA [Sphingomonas alba]|uniref:Magnesium transport protein CorA n=1 Tax=Sphingomonas alba TaxID=2908208 RepID=A0ABT0RL51_9SPHN|nr:magnesium/cobalt transporter CorA [Sphingomonas alba]MCL6683372.1 magnesium/cobalt transporter CorA [Sphingomonas alba]
MTLVAAYKYRGGERVEEVNLYDPNLVCEENEFVWVGVVEPTEEELASLQKKFDLHPLAVEDAHKAHQLPKVEVYGDQLFVVATTASFRDDAISYGETAIFVGKRHIVTVRHGSVRDHGMLRAQLEASSKLLAHGVDYVLHGVLDFIVDGYQPVVEEIEEDVLAIETSAVDAFLSREEVSRLFALRREVIRFQRHLGPMTEVCSRLVRVDLPVIDANIRPYFRDVLDHVQRVSTRVDAVKDAIASVFEVSTLFEQQRQGEITRKLAAWAAILAVPTAIAGIYGMNFTNMPEIDTKYGYYVVLVVIVALCTLLYGRFRRSGWL